MNKITKSTITILLGLVFLTTTGMVAASPATTSASPLYPFKKAIEAMTLALAAPENKAAVQATILEKRVAEMDALKLKIEALEKAQKLDQAQQLQTAATATELVAKQIATQAKANAELITNKTKKTEVLNRVNSSEQQIDDHDDDQEEIEEAEPEETPEPKEASENKEQETENHGDGEHNDEDD